MWVVIKIMVPSCVLNIIRHLVSIGYPKRYPNFDNYPCEHHSEILDPEPGPAQGVAWCQSRGAECLGDVMQAGFRV